MELAIISKKKRKRRARQALSVALYETLNFTRFQNRIYSFLKPNSAFFKCFL